MRFIQRFQVRAPLQTTMEFHSQPASMAAITPPPVIVQMQYAPARLSEGETMAFTLWLGPLPVRWLARIEATSAEGFVDRQVHGPFALWTHHHAFRPVNNETTEVVDIVEARLATDIWRALLGIGMWFTLPFLFGYRAWKTRRLLEVGKV